MLLMILNIKGTFNIGKMNSIPPTLSCESHLTKSFCSTEIDLVSFGKDTFAFSLASLPWFP